MVKGGLGSLLVRSGALAPQRLSDAERRQAVYGGTLDTVLLEMDAVEERTLLVHLAEATGMAAALPERLGAPDAAVVDRVTAGDARRLGVAPLGMRGQALELALRPGADGDQVAAWARERAMEIVPVVVPQVRLQQLHRQLYGDQMPPRLVALLGRLIGAEQARERLMERGPATAMRSPPVETGPARRTGRPEGAPRSAPLPTPAPLPTHAPAPGPVTAAPISAAIAESAEPLEIEIVEGEPVPPPGPPAEELIAALIAASDPLDLVRAIRALGLHKAERAVPLLIERLAHTDRTVASAAHAALVSITGQDRGLRVRGWRSWWSKAGDRDRVEWLLEALASSSAELRLCASDELRALTGMYFGYHFDLPARDREEARRRWADWWRTVGRPREAK